MKRHEGSDGRKISYQSNLPTRRTAEITKAAVTAVIIHLYFISFTHYNHEGMKRNVCMIFKARPKFSLSVDLYPDTYMPQSPTISKKKYRIYQ